MKKKLLITGCSGFLAWNLSQIARQQWQVYGTYYLNAVAIPGVKVFKIDLRNIGETQQLFKEIRPDAVIHTAAQSSPNFCQTHPEESYQINVTASLNLAALCADYNIGCVFTSTDLVFNGLNPPYKETNLVSPVSYYGEQKVLAEVGMLERYPKTAVCRMPLMFGIPSPTSNSFIQPFINSLREGKELNLFVDEFRNPVSATTAARGILLALEKVKGILHLGGKERMSRYDFGSLMAEVLELQKDLLKPCLQKNVKMAAPRPKDLDLDSSKAFNLGYQPLSVREELIALRGKV